MLSPPPLSPLRFVLAASGCQPGLCVSVCVCGGVCLRGACLWYQILLANPNSSAAFCDALLHLVATRLPEVGPGDPGQAGQWGAASNSPGHGGAGAHFNGHFQGGASGQGLPTLRAVSIDNTSEVRAQLEKWGCVGGVKIERTP